MHLTWVRTVAGRLEDRIRYSSSICYNNFPFPPIDEEQRKLLVHHAETVLLIRERYPDKTIADLYDPDEMPADLLDAHQALDSAEIVEFLQEENRVLREQLGGRRLRFTNAQRRRLAAKGKALGRRVLDQLDGLVTPDTILRWYHELIANKYDSTARRAGGGSGTAASLQRLVVQFATENPTWGYTRLRGALGNIGHELGRNTIKRILAEHGARTGAQARQDDTVEDLPQGALRCDRGDRPLHRRGPHVHGLIRYVVLFVIDLESRRVHIAGVTRQPHGAWIQQVARNLVDNIHGFLKGKRYLLHDRDPLFTDASARFSALQASRASSSLPAAQNLNAFRNALYSRSSPSA